MKYTQQFSEFNKILPTTENILIALPTDFQIDHLAAALALYLSLKQSGKKVSLITKGVLKVGHSYLFGVGDIKDKLPEVSGGDLTIVLGNVVVALGEGKGSVPALEKLEWFPEGTDLNLVFKVLPGQKFEPTHITPHYSGTDFGAIFTIGTSNLSNLGQIYTDQPSIFTNSHLINIDNHEKNNQFGKTIILENNTSLSEIVTYVIQSLNLPFDNDIATNLLAGIFTATSNLQSTNVTADTYEAITINMRAGGEKPTNIENITSADSSADLNKSSAMGTFKDFFGVSSINSSPEVHLEPKSSPEELPVGEEVITPESDWLTPKIYTGSKVG